MRELLRVHGDQVDGAGKRAKLDGDLQSADSGGVDPDPRITLDDLREDVVAVWAAENDAGAPVDVNGPDRLRLRHSCAQVPTAVVISTANTSCSRPATALPSSISSSISASGGSEAFGLDRSRLVSEPHERLGHGLDERRRPAGVETRPLGRRWARPRRASRRRHGARSSSTRAVANRVSVCTTVRPLPLSRSSSSR